MIAKPRATVQDLVNVQEHGKAELVNGEIVFMGATGGKPGRAGSKILVSLIQHEEAHGGGYALPDNVGFIVDLPNRELFSPDVAWYVGDVDSMKFLPGAPRFAVEVRSEYDYGAYAERAIRAKIADYFAAGTLVVWNVDLLGEDVITCYRTEDPNATVVFRRSDTADAEPAVPGWRFAVDKLLTR